ncbi:hypothetical protein PR048_004843 [Dryococelus australis]|uniref:DUF4817 domain-containing protein n=1 Tax=Dryococelus australis TaxID=614101 RepID=A0ABQ9I6I9_9NEOP|nr:hypothetical protein PR048_004843 [Dryococelus australis]
MCHPQLSHREIQQVESRSRQINQSKVRKLINCFRETGNVADRPQSGRPNTATNPETLTAILGHLTRNPKNLRKSSQIGHQHSVHPYKVYTIQNFHGDDTDRRKQFCEWFLDYGNPFILFNDEAIFYLIGDVKMGTITVIGLAVILNRAMTVVCKGIRCHGVDWNTGRALIGPYFFEDSATGVAYRHMLQMFLMNYLVVQLEQKRDIFFQQDEALPKFALIVQTLNHTFPNRWIG